MNVQSSLVAQVCVAALVLAPSVNAQANPQALDQHMPGKDIGTNGQSVLRSTSVEPWTGIWAETNGGLRDQLLCFPTQDPWVQIGVGSVLPTRGSFRAIPVAKFRMFRLEDSNGVVVPTRPGITMEHQFAQIMAWKDFPRPHNIFDSPEWGTNHFPVILAQIQLNEIYDITNEGEYTLTVGPVLYESEVNLACLDRVDFCHRSLQNQPAGVESKPATLRCFIHITLLDPSKWHFHYLIFARCSSAPPESLLADLGPPFGGAPGWMLFISAARSRLAKQSGISAGTRSAPASRRKATKARPNASVRSFRVEGPTQ